MEGRRPKTLCPACRRRLKEAASGRGTIERAGTLCFQCYRAELDRERALTAAGQIETASDARFQTSLPFDPVNRPRLDMLKADRGAARATVHVGSERFAERRRHAQIAARHALQTIAASLREVRARGGDRAIADAFHAAELQLPESWLPFVVAR